MEATQPVDEMTDEVRRVAAAYDPFHDPLLSDPYPFFALAREHAPVFHATGIDHWVIARHEDVKAILLDPETFSAANTIAPIVPLSSKAQRILRDGGWGQRPALGNNDPPDHARFRRNVQRAFTPRRVAQLEPFIRMTATTRLELLRHRGQADLMAELLYDLPALVILKLLGIPDDGVPIVREAGDNRIAFIWGRPTADEQERLAEAMVRFWHYLRRLIDERLAEPSDDLTSALLEVRAGDDSVFTLDEIASVLFAFLTAGHETTSSLLGNALRQLLARPAVWAELHADPALIPGTVEEVLRYDCPVVAWRRRARQDVVVGGTPVPEGEQLLLLLGSANRDETVFTEAGRFDHRRPNASAHLSFGHGIHFCLGAALARLEAKVVLEELTALLPSLRLSPGFVPRFVANTSFRGPLSLEVEWDA
ncbi:MAG: cytochrome P450 [Gaiellales bacterium]